MSLQWQPAWIGVGSNLSSPVRQVETAFELLDELPDTRLTATSGMYRSAAYGGIEQPDFVNAVAAIETQLTPGELLNELKALERARGRARGGVRWGPRVLDLDILVFSGEEMSTDSLTIPHPGIAERNFVLLPLKEVAPDLEIPGLGHIANIEVDMNEPRISRI